MRVTSGNTISGVIILYPVSRQEHPSEVSPESPSSLRLPETEQCPQPRLPLQNKTHGVTEVNFNYLFNNFKNIFLLFRSILAKSGTETVRTTHGKSKIRTFDRVASSEERSERLRMMKSLEGGRTTEDSVPSEVTARSLRTVEDSLPSEVTAHANTDGVEMNMNPAEHTNNENVICTTTPGTEEPTDSASASNVSQYPSTQHNYTENPESASESELGPVTCQQAETESVQENSSQDTEGTETMETDGV